MTTPQNSGNPGAPNSPVSLPFDPATLAQGIRVRPADFARMCVVSRQTVSRWVKSGLVLLYPDGTLDPAAAAKRVWDNTDPGRLRARIFKDMTLSVDDWRRRAAAAESELAAEKKRIAYLDSLIQESNLTEEKFLVSILENIDALHAVAATEREAMLSDLLDEACISAGVQLGTIPADPEKQDFSDLDAAMDDLLDRIDSGLEL